MATRADFEKMNVLIAEAIALCEAAQQELERINKDIQDSIHGGRELMASVEIGEGKAREKLCAARRLLLDRVRQRRRFLQRRPLEDD